MTKRVPPGDLIGLMDGIRDSVEIADEILTTEARYLAKEANARISHFSSQGVDTKFLAMTVRRWKDTWGPRLLWVRIKYPPLRKLADGTTIPHSPDIKPRSDPIPLHGNYRVRRRIFKPLEPELRDELNHIEDRAAVLRECIDLFGYARRRSNSYERAMSLEDL